MSKLLSFFDRHPVFTLCELREAVGANRSPHTLRNLLQHHVRAGRIGRVERGLYYTVPQGQSAESYIPDRFILGARMAPDAVLGYHSAFEVLGLANQTFTNVYYISSNFKRPLRFQGTTYCCVLLPKALRNHKAFGLQQVERAGVMVPVTTPERTVVDCLDRLEYAGGWDEFNACLQGLPFLDLDLLMTYVGIRGKRTLAAKVGYVLEQLQTKFYVSGAQLRRLERMSPRSPITLRRQNEEGMFARRWNLVVPRSWVQGIS